MITNFDNSDDWRSSPEEGQLSVDIFDTVEDIIVLSTVAGATQEDLDISIHNDLLTIRGSRKSPTDSFLQNGQIIEFFHSECFWGRFSRTIVLPYDVKSELTTATLQNGILMIRLPKRSLNNTRIPITIIED
jgi:HSP20 family protein